MFLLLGFISDVRDGCRIIASFKIRYCRVYCLDHFNENQAEFGVAIFPQLKTNLVIKNNLLFMYS